MESITIKQESDMRLLDFRVRISLAILLDENDNWRQLCRLMNFSTLESGFATFSSPTKEVLAMFEVSQILMFHPSPLFLIQLSASDCKKNLIPNKKNVHSLHHS